MIAPIKKCWWFGALISVLIRPLCVVHLVMRGARFQFEQEILVETVVFRRADVVSGKGADRFLGLPERDHQKMCGIALHTP